MNNFINIPEIDPFEDPERAIEAIITVLQDLRDYLLSLDDIYEYGAIENIIHMVEKILAQLGAD